MSTKENFDKVYEKPGAIWTIEDPPKELKELLVNGIVKPCKALDLGCGEGFYSIYLAKNGFDVTAIDFSRQALKYAKANADKAGVKINFKILDVINLNQLNDTFGFVFEWGLLHHLSKDKLDGHFSRIDRILDADGLYLTASFNIDSPVYGNPGDKSRDTPIGTKLEYYSIDELRLLLSKYFVIIDERIIRLNGRGVSQPGNFFLLRKK